MNFRLLWRAVNFKSYSFVYTVCVILSIPPLIFLTTLFWTKGIDTQMMITHTDEFSLPSFTICSDFRNLVDFAKVAANRSMHQRMNRYFLKKNITERLFKTLNNDAIIRFFGSQMGLGDLLFYVKNVSLVLESISLYGIVNLPPEDLHLNHEEIGEKCRFVPLAF